MEEDAFEIGQENLEDDFIPYRYTNRADRRPPKLQRRSSSTPTKYQGCRGAHDNDNSLSDLTVCFTVNSNSNFVNTSREHTCNAGINEIFICDDTFNDFCLFENDTSFDFKNFGSNNFISLEIDEIADFDINLDFLNNISFSENDANCTNLVNSTFIKIIDQFSETKVEAIVNGTGVENSNEYEPNQNESNSNSEENLLYFNDTYVNSNHVVIDVNKSIVCNEIETSVTKLCKL